MNISGRHKLKPFRLLISVYCTTPTPTPPFMFILFLFSSPFVSFPTVLKSRLTLFSPPPFPFSLSENMHNPKQTKQSGLLALCCYISHLFLSSASPLSQTFNQPSPPPFSPIVFPLPSSCQPAYTACDARGVPSREYLPRPVRACSPSYSVPHHRTFSTPPTFSSERIRVSARHVSMRVHLQTIHTHTRTRQRPLPCP